MSQHRADLPPTFEGRRLPNPDEPPYDQGLQFDLETVLDRRSILKLLGYGAIAVGLAGCAPGSTFLASLRPTQTPAAATVPPSAASTAAGSASAACSTIPAETAGPYPGDGSNGPNVLTQSGIVRADIRSSFGGSTAVAAGVPLTIRLALQDVTKGCSPLANAAVYLWQCDQPGRYSLYSQGVTNENYLRGVQAAGSDGLVTFQSIFPGCYSGRWPHIHFEVYPSLDRATNQANKIATSQIALPEAACRTVYGLPGYEQSVTNMRGVSLQRDMVFGEDGGARQLGAVTGDVTTGLTVTLAVPVASS